jgi:hypothetical protein
MTTPSLDTLTQRLDRLERENRRLTLIGTLALSCLVTLVLTGQAAPRAVPRLVEAEQFILRDTGGKVRATLGTVNGTTGLALLDRNQKERLLMWVDAEGEAPSIVAYDTSNKRRLVFGLSPQNKPMMGVYGERGEPSIMIAPDHMLLADKAGQIRAQLSLGSEGEPSLVLYGNDGRTELGLSVLAKNEPRLRLVDKDGRGRVMLALLQDGSGGVFLSDPPKGKLRVALATNSNNAPTLTFFDPTGQRRIVLGVYPHEPDRHDSLLGLFDSDDKLVWKAP